ncbi:MAG: hypothetical protein C0594_15750 [Marinilabiliales bacterium]|nr:MAG: hypothetical protein C0594_15750 [Marinilabiliales bacterium]
MLFVILFIGSAIAQVNPDSKLFVKYEPSYFNKYQHKNPEIIEYMNFYVNHSWKIINMPDKEVQSEELKKVDPKTGSLLDEQIVVSDLDNFNIYLYNCKPDQEKRKYYTIGDTKKMLIIYSHNEITDKFNKRNEN